MPANPLILVACEFSGRVREAFRRAGCEAWSCDLLPAEDGSPFHIMGDALTIASERAWDLMLAFPPCTDLAVSGARWFAAKRADGRQQRSVDFFLRLASAPVRRKALENPVGIMSRLLRKPDQIVQPWQFGHGETKATCLWLWDLPLLEATQTVAGREGRVWREPPGPDRWKNRSRTYPGIAEAMGYQWGGYLRRLKGEESGQAMAPAGRAGPLDNYLRNKLSGDTGESPSVGAK